jgi:anti-sigma factor RsiW
MKITRDVINDLMPVYLSGEGSADTRALVEEYFEQDPAFARETQRAAEALHALPALEPGPLDSRIEKGALQRAKRLLQIQKTLLALASTFSLNALSLCFSFEVGNGRTRIHWLTLPGQLKVVLAILLLAVVTWCFYFFARHRVRTRVLR